jgi:hypothetical protein
MNIQPLGNDRISVSEMTPWVFSPMRIGRGDLSNVASVKVSPALIAEPPTRIVIGPA